MGLIYIDNMKKTIKIATLIAIMFSLFCGTPSYSQSEVADTVIINFGNNSRIIFFIDSKDDLDQLKQYDLNELVKDFSMKVENADGEQVLKVVDESGERFLKDTTIVIKDPVEIVEREHEDDSSFDDRKVIKRYRTRHFFNIDLGMNNYLENGEFPSSYNANHAVRPWGSWYVSLSSLYKSQVAGSLFIEYGAGISWYNFKFENNETRLIKDDIQVSFINDVSGFNYKKSKLTASYLNISLVPMLYFKSNENNFGRDTKRGGPRKSKYDKGFRIGAGGYGGYRIGSHAKYVYKQEGNSEKDKDKDSFYLNNWRYGVRLQLGYKGTDLFFNYDVSELFSENRGPKLNAFSFGITL